MRVCRVDARCALLYEWFRYRVLYVCNKVVIFWLKNTTRADFLDFFAYLRVKSNEALDVDEIFLEE